MDTLRKPAFVLAVAFFALALLVEAGSGFFSGIATVQAERLAATLEAPAPGVGVPYLAVLDGLLVLTVLLIGLSLVVPERIHGRVQGVATLVVALLALLAAILMIGAALLLLALMLGLLLAPVFGTLAYFAIYGHFDRTGASAVLGLAMTAKLAGAVLLVVAHRRFLQNKGLVSLVLTSLVGTLLVSVLHGFVPLPLVSIADVVAALVLAVAGAVWAFVFLIGAVVSVVKAVG